MQRLSLVLFFCFFIFSAPVNAETIRVAVASNFYVTMRALSEPFEQSTGHQVELVVGSSGKLASQIISGAPFDLFMSADISRPAQLEKQGLAIQGTRKTYAKGQLAVLLRYMQKRNDLESQSNDWSAIKSFDVDRIAIANPDLAPYGRAAKQAMNFIGLQFDRKKIVYGENVSQVFHFFATGNVDVAFVAMSQVMEREQYKNGKYKDMYVSINEKYYEPIEQQMVLLNDRQETRDLYRYILSEQARQLISQSGYSSVNDSVNAGAFEIDSWNVQFNHPDRHDQEKDN